MDNSNRLSNNKPLRVHSPDDQKEWLAKVYIWMEKTHTNTARLIAWLSLIAIAFVLYALSPVLAFTLVLIGVFRVEKLGSYLEACFVRIPHWSTIEPILVVPLFGLYFLVVLKLFEIDLDIINLRPPSPFLADIVNFLGGCVLGFLVSRKIVSAGSE